MARFMFPVVAVALCALAHGLPCDAQQPNGVAVLGVQFRFGPSYPIVATAPNSGTVFVGVWGPPSMPFVLISGPLHPGAYVTGSGQSIDVGTPPALADIEFFINGFAPGPAQPLGMLDSGGAALLTAPVPGGTFAVPPLQAIVLDPANVDGLSGTAASQVTLTSPKGVLFIQGDFDPGFGYGPHCRIADTGALGFSTLRDLLALSGLTPIDEVVDTSFTVTPAALAPYGVVVLGSNQRAFAAGEVTALEQFVLAGGGLLSYGDSTFGANNWNSDNQVLSHFGMYEAADNFGGPVTVTGFVPHPIVSGLSFGFTGEGVSLIEAVGGPYPLQIVAPCSLNMAACSPIPASPSGASGTPNFAALVCCDAGLGRVAATFDRNTFFNVPGLGTNITEASNALYALNLFLWVGHY